MINDMVTHLRRKLPSLEILEDEPMSRHCSFRIGGSAKALAIPKNTEEIASLCRELRSIGEKPLIIGNGTNILFTDAPMDRIIIKLGDSFSETRTDGESIIAQSGVSLARLAGHALESGLTLLEFAHGIPGTLGGAVSMNAGAYGSEMKDVIVRTTYLGENLEFSELSGDEHEFSYRRSFFSDSGCVVLSCELLLKQSESGVIRAKMRELAARRRESQPLDLPSAGSTFKRPAQGYAAQMIDEAGLKGYRTGGAMVSEKHAGFVVNAGGASFNDVMRVIDHVRERVFAIHGVELELEVKVIK